MAEQFFKHTCISCNHVIELMIFETGTVTIICPACQHSQYVHAPHSHVVNSWESFIGVIKAEAKLAQVAKDQKLQEELHHKRLRIVALDPEYFKKHKPEYVEKYLFELAKLSLAF